MKASVYPLKGRAAPFSVWRKRNFSNFTLLNRREAKQGAWGDNPPKQVWVVAQYHPFLKKRSFRADCEAVYD